MKSENHPFTPRLKRMMERARKIASKEGDSFVGTEHVFAAMAFEEEGPIPRMLQISETKISPEDAISNLRIIRLEQRERQEKSGAMGLVNILFKHLFFANASERRSKFSEYIGGGNIFEFEPNSETERNGTDT